MIKPSKVDIQSEAGIVVENLLLSRRETPDTLAVIFPGSGYTCDKPLLHYAREIALQAGADVLSLRYFFQQENKPATERMIGATLADARAAIDTCLPRGYKRLAFISKSLGTRLASTLGEASGLPVHQFYLTPLLDAVDHIRSAPCTVVAGAADPLFTPSLHMSLKASPIVDLHVIPNARHSLEIPNDYRRSLEALSQVCSLLDAFMRQ